MKDKIEGLIKELEHSIESSEQMYKESSEGYWLGNAAGLSEAIKLMKRRLL
jgi:hypothetical protein